MLGRFHIEHVFFHTFKTVDDRYYIEIEHDFRYYRIKHNYNTQKNGGQCYVWQYRWPLFIVVQLLSYCLLTSHIKPRGSDCRSNTASVSGVFNN